MAVEAYHRRAEEGLGVDSDLGGPNTRLVWMRHRSRRPNLYVDFAVGTDLYQIL